MDSQSVKPPLGDQYELEVLEVFGEEYMVEICEAIYDLYELDLPFEVAQKLIQFENRLKIEMESDPYGDYLTDYYSAWAEEYEGGNRPSEI